MFVKQKNMKDENSVQVDESLDIDFVDDFDEEDFIPNLRKSLKRDKIAKDNQRNRWKIKN